MNKIWIITIIIIVIILFICFGIKSPNKESFSLFSSSTATKEPNRKISSMTLNNTSTDDDSGESTTQGSSDDDPSGTGITGTYAMRDYYIFSSYNSCNNNTTTSNNKVDTQSLKNVISQGVRLLDFEVYSLNNDPIVATSSIPNNYFIKESNSSVPFRNVFDTIINTAFNISTAPNPTDPLFIHLRIQSTNQKMFSNLALIIKNYENSGYILGPQYSFEYQECKDSTNNDLKCSIRNITSLPLNKFKSKIILIIDKQNTNVLDNKDLMEFCNLMSNSINCRLITNYEMKNSPDQNELIEFNKRSVCIVTPDIGAKPDNPNISTANLLGIQFTAINFSNEDSLYTKTMNLFNDNGSAFILKPENLRYVPLYVPVPNDPPPGYSFAPRTMDGRYFNFQI
jgi:hypothetical protein